MIRAWAGLFVGGLVVVAGCSGPGDGPVTFDSVRAVKTAGTTSPVTFHIAWSHGPPFERVNAGSAPLPAAFVPVKGASGDVESCGKGFAGYRYAVLAVGFPSTGGKPASVKNLEVTYEASDHSYTEVVHVWLTQCPAGTVPVARRDDCLPG